MPIPFFSPQKAPFLPALKDGGSWGGTLNYLDERQAIADAFCATIQGLPNARDGEQSTRALATAIEQSGLDADLAVDLVDLVLFGTDRPWRGRGQRQLRMARITAHLMPHTVGAPSIEEARAAYVRLAAPDAPMDSAHEALHQHHCVHTVARALATGLYPVPLEALATHPAYMGAIIARRITQGHYDEAEPTASGDMAEAIGEALHKTGNTLGDLDRLMTTANAHLAARGAAPLTPQACQRVYAHTRVRPKTGAR